MISTSVCNILLLATAATYAAAGNLTVEAGYHAIYTYEGTTIPPSIFKAAEDGLLGGILLFGANIADSLPDQIASLQSAYASSAAYAGAPLLIVTDQEGGEVNRLPGGPDASAKEQGEASNPSAAAAAAGDTTAQVFSAYNVNGDLAPVLGVFRKSGDFLDQYQRSYGDAADLVSECVGPFVTHLQSNGYAATAKHFPGLGAATASEDTDVEPVTLNLSLTDLRNIDMKPYAAAIQSGVKMVMPSWAVYPALDASRPSGLSTKWLQDELRGTLGFTGVTISDAITAGALKAYGSVENRAILATNAGMDIILVTGNNPANGTSIVSALVKAVQDGTISESAFSAASQRILNMRQSLPI